MTAPCRRARACPFRLTATPVAVALLLVPGLARASLLSGEALDTMADVIAWIALIVVPVVVIGVFWIVHILPEKIAHQRRHPQLAAIKTLCLLSLFFGGLLWPLAWLWAYTKPVLHKLAYGTDRDEHDDHDAAVTPFKDASGDAAPPAPATAAPVLAAATVAAAPATESTELEDLRRRLRALEMAVAMTPGPGRAGAAPAPGGGERT